MLQPSPVPADPFAERLRTPAGRRAVGIGVALLLELLLLLLLLSLGQADTPGKENGALTVVEFTGSEDAEDAPEPSESPEREQAAEERPVPRPPAAEEPLPPTPLEPQPVQPPRAVIPTPRQQAPAADVYPRPIQPAPAGRPVAGPPSTGGSSSGDTARVGTAPNGEPLYAAAWYREPRDDELRGYLSTASGPGWGLIACRTAPDYRVEDCVALSEWPQGSLINRAVLAAAWQFKVRPPRLGGRTLVGSWVRIRIDYTVSRE